MKKGENRMQKNTVLIGLVIIAAAIVGSFYYASTESKKPNLPAAQLKVSQKAEAEPSGPVAAKVNGEIIRVSEIRKGYDENPQIAGQLPFDEFYQKALDVFVNGKLLYQAAEKAKVSETAEYENELKTLKEDLARKIFLEEAVEEKVTPAAIQAFYETEYVSKFTSQRERNAKHILLEDEATAKKVLEKLNAGEDFDTVAKEYTKDKTVELGYFTEDLMVPEFVAAVKTLKVGEYTKAPVKTQFGYHVVLLIDERDSAPLPLKELEPQIKNILDQQAVAEIFDKLYKESKIEKYDLDGNKIPETAVEK